MVAVWCVSLPCLVYQLYLSWNGAKSYTIVGGYSDTESSILESSIQLTKAYMVDYNPDTQAITHFKSFEYNNQSAAAYTHFEGVTTDGGDGYNLVGEWLESGVLGVSFVNVPRTESGGFGEATWINVAYPGSSTTTGDTVYQNYALGVYKLTGESQTQGYVATIPTGFY